MTDFGDWYSALTQDEIIQYVKAKRGKQARKMGWWEWFEDCYKEWRREEAEDDAYRDEMAWLGRNYWRI